ncbi:MAG: helix-turn-helix domain-containing protein [Chloroflexi bacterium]|nr:helix-turn-helix domain-containing protein [Chloroflexota bacterium]
MPRRSRPQVAPTEDWQQLSLLVDWPEQLAYELLRPVVLFGRSPVERAQETQTAERTLRRKARRFDQIGMASLFADEQPPSAEDRRCLPPPLRQLIVDLKAEYPAFRLGEIAQVCFVASGRRPSPHTIQRVLATGPAPKQTWRRYPRYADMLDPADRRHAIVQLHAERHPEGTRITCIAGYLRTSRQTVYTTLRRWASGYASCACRHRRLVGAPRRRPSSSRSWHRVPGPDAPSADRARLPPTEPQSSPRDASKYLLLPWPRIPTFLTQAVAALRLTTGRPSNVVFGPITIGTRAMPMRHRRPPGPAAAPNTR